MTLFRRLSALAAVLVLVQIVLGAIVRLTDSGVSCPDWPLCYGLWFPTPARLAALPEVGYSFGQVMAEWTHRLNAAALVSPLTLALAWLAWRGRAAAPGLWPIMAAALAALLVQAGLGGFTVLDRNSPWSVAVHLIAALILLALLLAAHLAARPRPAAAAPAAGTLPLIVLAALLAAATAASGAMMAKSGASLACASWPLCDGAVIPDLSDPGVQLNFGHRLLALGAAAAMVVLWLWARASAAGARPPLVRAANMLVAILALQVLLGAGVVHAFAGPSLGVQVAVGAVHQAIGVVLFATLVVMAWLARAPRGRAV